MRQTNTAPPADRREHPRVQVPLEVEIAHPSIGRHRCRVRDVSQDGLFLEYPEHGLAAGARLRMTPIAAVLIGHDHQPTVELEVVRVADDGIGTRFANRTQAYLFTSFRQRRSSLEVGVDYFQVFVAALITDDAGRLLVVDENGRWLFPGTFLSVGRSIEQALGEMLGVELTLELAQCGAPIATATLDGGLAPEGATLALFQRCSTHGEAALGADSRFKRLRWLQPGRDPSDLAFADPYLRELARRVLMP